MADLASTRNGLSSGPSSDVVELMQTILGDKPLACDDITSIAEAKKELRRIRKLMANFAKTETPTIIEKKKKQARKALHEEENINDYVKNTIDKPDSIRDLIYKSIKGNVLFESNTEDELKEIVDVFEPCSFDAGGKVITQGEKGDDFFVVESGELSITVRMTEDTADGDDELLTQSSVNEVRVGSYQEGSSFGELALIYGSPRAATIAATDDCKLWRIKRSWYRGVVGQLRKRLHMEKVKFLPGVKVGTKKFGDVLLKGQIDTMAQLLKQEYFKRGDTILREGEAGNTFYIIQSGEVSIFKKELGPKPIATLGKEKFFGEKALLKDDVRQATVVALSERVVCYVMTRPDFVRVLGNLQDLLEGKTKKARTSVMSKSKPRATYKLKDLTTLNVLGQGAFGKVKLVKAKDTGTCYALKAQGKEFIVQNGQKVYILNELKLMHQLSHPNILVLNCAMQDSKYIYFLLDLLPGGELMDILEKKGKFPADWVKFYAASVILAYTCFHENRVAYRDLKPENLVLDAQGYCVVVDLGLAKQLNDGPTYTFCGTPDYIAPELIRGTGYNWAVDYWALGVLLYELHCGSAPFQSYDPTGTAKKILKGRVSFPPKFDKPMAGLVNELLKNDPTRRLGCMSDGTEGVVKHRFYQGFDWEALERKKMDTPYKPDLPKDLEKIGKRDVEKDTAKTSKWNPNLDSILKK